MKLHLFTLLFALSVFDLFGQSANLQIEFNHTTQQYAVSMVATDNSFNSSNTFMGNCQITIVGDSSLTASSFINISTSNPQGSIGQWSLNSTVESPAAAPGSDFYAFGTFGGGTSPAQFPSGTKITLFTFELTNGCSEGLRVFANPTDPNSAAAGMQGGDFSNNLYFINNPNAYNTNVSPNIVNCDTDGDGIVDVDEPATQNDPCLPAQAKDYTGYVNNNAVWMAADCDGDGKSNGAEFTDGNDPYDACDPDPFAVPNNGCVTYVTIGPLKAGESETACLDTSWVTAGPFTATDCDGNATGTLGSGGTYTIDAEGCLSFSAPATIASSSVDSVCIRICDANDDCKTSVVWVGLTNVDSVTVIDSIPPGDSVQICLDTSWVVTGPVVINDCAGNSSGTTVSGGTYTIDSDGCVNYISNPNVVENFIDSICVSVCDGSNCDTTYITIPVIPVRLVAKVLLEGALFNGIGPAYMADTMMRDDLRDLGHLPTTDPYTANPAFTHAGDGAEVTATANAFDENGDDSVVDWIFLQFRDGDDSTVVVETMSLLVQRDGDIVSVNGVDPFVINPKHIGESYFISVRHRNHLGAMTATAMPINRTGTLVDFTDVNATFHSRDVVIGGNTFDYSSMVMANVSGKYALFAGNANHDNKVKYATDYNQLFADVVSSQTGGTIVLNYDNANGYFSGDLNLDGKVKYQGTQPDGLILSNQILFAPTNTQINTNFDFFLEMLPNQN